MSQVMMELIGIRKNKKETLQVKLGEFFGILSVSALSHHYPVFPSLIY